MSEGAATSTHETESEAVDPLTLFKNFYSSGLLIFSIAIIMAVIFQEDTKLSRDVHPGFAFVMVWGCLIWLNMVEGGQGSLVGLPPVRQSLYEESHPMSYKCCKLAHKGDNLDRYLMGRQFMVLIIVFMTNLSAAPLPDTIVFGSQIITDIFLGTGLSMILLTACAGQLNSQVNASHCMLDYINNFFALFTLWVAMGIEFSGLLHSSYLIQNVCSMASGKPIESAEPPKEGGTLLFFWARVLFSCFCLGFALAVTFAAIFAGQTAMWEGVPPIASCIVTLILWSCVGMLEGMQIAFFAVAKLQKCDRGDAKFAKMTCELLFRGRGKNLAGFMIGRQFCVTLCFFVAARATTITTDVEAGDDTIFGVSEGLQGFFNTGLLGALATTIVASITWQLVASAFPIPFLSNPLVYVFLRVCLFLEATGLLSAAWVLAYIHKRIAGFQYDEVYIGTPEERAAMEQADHDESLHIVSGMAGAPAHKVGEHAYDEQDFRFHSTTDNLEHEVKDLREQVARMQQRMKMMMGDSYVEPPPSDTPPPSSSSGTRDLELTEEQPAMSINKSGSVELEA